MALIGVFEHPKTIELANRMGLPINHVVGILEHLWHWTARYTPAGDIARYRDSLPLQIAPEGTVKRKILFKTMVEVGFLDEEEAKKTLIVHNWSKRADKYVHRKLLRAGIAFADGTFPKSYQFAGKSSDEGTPCGTPEGTPCGTPEGTPCGTQKGNRGDTPREPSRARPEPEPEPVSSASAGACASVRSGWGEEFLAELKKTGKFPRVTKDTIVMACRGAEGTIAAVWPEIVAGAAALPDARVGSPLAWLQAQVNRLEFKYSQKKKPGAAAEVYRSLSEREGSGDGGCMTPIEPMEGDTEPAASRAVQHSKPPNIVLAGARSA